MWSAIKWSRLRGVGNSNAVKLTILIPVLGYFILFNENIVGYLDLSKEIFGLRGRAPGITSTSPVPTRLLLLYFGLCFVAVGSMSYELFCPLEIKKYRSPAEYIGDSSDSISVLEITQIERRIKNSIERSIKNSNVKVTLSHAESLRVRWEKDHDGKIIEDVGTYRKRNGEFEAALLDIYYEVANRRHPIARAVSAAFFGIGFVALAIPSLEAFLRIASKLATAFF